MKIVIIDNYDSFTFNLVHLVRELGCSPCVLRNDRFDPESLADFDKILLSPGPGIPSEAALMPEVIRRYAASKPILGVCLGEQALGEAFGARLVNLESVFHGVQTPCRLTVRDYLFDGLPEVLLGGGRRHAARLPGGHRPERGRAGNGPAPPQPGPARRAVPSRKHPHAGRKKNHRKLVESLKENAI